MPKGTGVVSGHMEEDEKPILQRRLSFLVGAQKGEPAANASQISLRGLPRRVRRAHRNAAASTTDMWT